MVAPSVKADTVEANPEAGSTTEGIKPVVAEEDVTYAAPAVEVAPSTLVAPDTVVTEEKAEKPVATTENSKEEAVATTTVSVDKSQLEAVLAQAKAKSLEGQEASVKAEVAAAIAEAEALVANGSASQEKVNQSVERLTQALASVKEVTEVVAEKRSEATTESSETPKIRNKRAVEGSLRSVDESNLQRAVVTKENFESFFQEGGTASYDKSTGTIKLTDDVSGQVGSAYLRFKIDSGQPFTFTGKVDIGDKYEGHTVGGRPGGDGVGFVFHTGNVDTIGQDGASIGMGTIKNAFGFKLDSWHNTSNPNANQNASADPRYGGNAWRSNAFGSFYSSNNAGRVTTSSSAAKALNPAPSGQWVDFKIEYDSQKNFTVTYGSQTWTTNLKNASTSIMTTDAKNAFKNNPTFALSFLGSTGSGSNLQRVQIERFEFTAPQIVHMKFVDTKGNEIEASSAIPGDRDQVINLSTQDSKIAAVEAKGYKLKRIDHSKARSYNEANNTVTLKEGGQLLTYIFEEKEKDAASIQAPTNKVPVKNTTALTEDEKSSVEAAVKAVNPKATKVEVATDGAATVTFEDGTTATLTGDKTVKEADSKGVKAPTTKTPVQNTSALTQPEKDAVKKAVEDANQTATKVEVGNDGSATVTFPDGTTATLPGAKTVKEADSKGVQEPAAKTPVKDTSALTDEEKTQVAEEIVKANPTLEDVDVANDGTATVTFPDGSTATLTPAQTVVKAEEKSKDADGLKAPETKTPVKDTANLTDAEKAEVKKAVEAANPGSVAEVGQDGTTKVTFPDKSEGTLTGDQTVKAADANGAKAPEAKTPVKDTANLTEEEKTQVAEEILKANPTLADVDVANDGTATVTFPDGSKATLTPAQTVVKAEEKAKDADGLKAPETKTPVKDTANLTDAEKAEVKKAVEAANPGSVAEVGQDGTTTVTFPDGSTATLTGNKTVKEADSKGVQEPAAKTPVQNTSALTQPEKDAVKKAVEDANPTATKVEVGNDGSATVTFPDVSTATLTPAQTVVKAEDKEAPTAPVVNPVKAGDTAVTGTAEAGSTVEVTLPNGTKATATASEDGTFSVPVSGLKEDAKVSVTATDAAGNKSGATEATVAKADDKTAPDAPKVNEVKAGDTAVTGTAEAGSTVEVTLPNGTKATATAGEDGTFSIPVSGLNEGDKVSVTATDAAGNKSGATEATVAKADDKEAPAAPVVNDVKEGDKAVTGTAEVGSIIEIILPNSETVTVRADEAGHFSLPVVGLKAGDKVTAVAKDSSGNTSTPTEKTVGKRDVKDADGIQVPSTKTPVKDTANLTDAEKAKVKEAVEAANPGSKAEVGQDGTTTVTFPDGSTATLTGDQTVKAADANGVKVPSTKTPVKDTANLTDAEKAEVKKAVEAANPGSKAEVGQDGTTTVTFPDGSTATLTGDKTVTQADITAPTAPVVNPVKAGDTAVTGTAEAGSTVEVTLPDGSKVSAKADKDGKFSIPVSGLHAGDTVSVTATDEAGNASATTSVTVSKVGGKDADNAKVPALTPVVDPNNLTDAEKAKVAEEVKKANPTATDVKVNNDGSVVVTFEDGSVATIAANKVVKEATKESSAQAPAKKAGAKELPNTGTKQSNASLGLALLAAVTGGLLVSKKRKEEE